MPTAKAVIVDHSMIQILSMMHQPFVDGRKDQVVIFTMEALLTASPIILMIVVWTNYSITSMAQVIQLPTIKMARIKVKVATLIKRMANNNRHSKLPNRVRKSNGRKTNQPVSLVAPAVTPATVPFPPPQFPLLLPHQVNQ